jgi:Zn-dependent metalloprotease
MSTLNPTQDSRTSYDETTGAVRSFFGAELVEPLADEKLGRTTETKTDDFLEANQELFKLENITLQKADTSEGNFVESVDYTQLHQGIPVYGAQLIVGLRKRDGQITSTVNRIDYQIPEALGLESTRLSVDEVIARMHEQFDGRFGMVDVGTVKLFVYRHTPIDLGEQILDAPPIRREMLSLSTGSVGQVYLVWQVMMDTTEPSGFWEVLVDAINGDLVAVKDRSRYETRKAYVFWPDPVRSSQNDNLSWNISESTLNAERKEVTLENLVSPVNNKYKLSGTQVNIAEREDPSFVPSEVTDDFKYGTKQREFLSVMAYYYLDRLIAYLLGFKVKKFNDSVANKPLDVDAQGYYGKDNSHFVVPNSGKPFIAYGEGGVPDASDAGVIVHEYGHALHYYLGKEQYSYEEGFNDFLAVCWLDRFNEHQFQREEVFPWDQHANGTTHWDANYTVRRRVNVPQKFDDANFPSYDYYAQGNVWATALWDIFLNIGGNSPDANVRQAAADTLIHLYMEMLLTVADNNSTLDQFKHAQTLANALITVDESMSGGLYKKVIWDAFRRRGLWKDFTPIGNIDPYIRDSSGDTGEHASPEVHWTSPDIWVRNNPPPANPNDPNDPNYGENPDDGHQSPINDVPNYMYVRVHNRGSQAVPANTFSVEAFHCSPATAMLYPDHFQSTAKLTIAEPIPANGGSVRVGPFIWTPQIKDHECLFAIVDGVSDPAIAKQLKGSVDHWKLVRYDNNVGQVNVAPQSSVPGGKTKTSFLVRGTVYSSLNQLTVDASALPSDTHIEMHLARRLTDQAAGLSGFILSSQNTRWSTLTLPGGQVGAINDFPLEAYDQKSVTLMVDFSYQAEHLHRYPIIVTQTQEGQISGRLTIEITAVKETEDFVYGNPNSMELHTIHCPLWSRIAQHHKIPFMTVKDGIVRGYNGCAFCLPEYNTG